MALHSPLDLERIFVVDFAGTPEIFTFVSIIIIGWIIGKFKFDNTETLALFALFGIIMASYLPAIYVLINLFVGIFVAYSISKMTR